MPQQTSLPHRPSTEPDSAPAILTLRGGFTLDHLPGDCLVPRMHARLSADPRHRTGNQLIAELPLVRAFESESCPIVSAETHAARFSTVLSWAGLLTYSALGNSAALRIDAVIAYGSYLRGKATAGDVDIAIITNPDDGHGGEYMYQTKSPTEKRIASVLTRMYGDACTIDGRPLQVSINSDLGFPGSMVESEPMIMITRGPGSAELQAIGVLNNRGYQRVKAELVELGHRKGPIVATFGIKLAEAMQTD